MNIRVKNMEIKHSDSQLKKNMVFTRLSEQDFIWIEKISDNKKGEGIRRFSIL